MALDDPDLPAALGYLRSTALSLSPHGLATKLIIPNDQILYTQVMAPGPDKAARLAQIRAALEGRTPYDVADLAFDWRDSGDQVQVAVIARETLAEAEAFAVEHRFNPVAFVALPQDGAFEGEPWFGPTALAASLLADGEQVEPDQDPVNVQTRGFAMAPQPEVAPDAMPEPVQTPQEIPAPEPEPEPEPEFVPEYAPEEFPVAEPEPEPEFVPEPEPELEPAPPQTAPENWRPADALPRIFLDDLALAEPEPEPEPAAAPMPEAEEAPMALDVPDDEPEAAPVAEPPKAANARVLDPVIDDEVPPLPSAAAMMAFASRRAAEDSPPGTGGKIPALGAAIPAKGAVARPAIAKPLPNVAARPAAAAPAPRPNLGAKPNTAGKALRGLGAMVTAPTIAGGKKPKPPITPVQITPKPSPAQASPPRSGIGLGGKPAPVRGKPRHLGLILTLALLVGLALVAAWSTYALAFWQGSDPAVDTAVMQSETPAPDDEMLADMQDPAELAAANTAEQLGEPTPDPAAPALSPAPETAVDLAASTGTAPASEPQDEILLAAMDAPPNTPDPLALPQADARGDPLPAAQPAPPPFGTVYQFDADGLIRPTPEGIITPEGVLLIAGKPPLVPAPRPAEIAAQAALLPALPAETALPVNPALIGKKPQARPEGLAPTAPDDDAAIAPGLAPAADSRLAGLRPQARPTAVLAAGEEARLASANASLAAQAESTAAETAAAEAATAGRSKMAVAISRKPEPRPRDLSKSVEAAVAAAIRAPEPEPEPETAAKAPEKDASPEADNEPETASAAPSIPTRASVAKQATFKNAINLSKVNLIGVYGSDSNRHALIRQANGRFKKVQVGDKIDGGQIAAITATEVRYKKSGKMITLAMPKG